MKVTNLNDFTITNIATYCRNNTEIQLHLQDINR